MDILELSHSINAESASKAAASADAPKARGRPRKNSDPEIPSALKPPKETKINDKEQKKLQEEKKEAVEEAERVNLIRKINAHLDSPLLSKLIADLDLKQLKGNESIAIVKNTWERIQNKKGMHFKRMFVNQCFDLGANTIQAIGCNLFKLQHFTQYVQEIEKNKDLFEQEIEEIAIDISDSMIPSPAVRLLLKVGAFTKDFHKEAGLNRSPAPKGRSREPAWEEEEEFDEDELNQALEPAGSGLFKTK